MLSIKFDIEIDGENPRKNELNTIVLRLHSLRYYIENPYKENEWDKYINEDIEKIKRNLDNLKITLGA